MWKVIHIPIPNPPTTFFQKLIRWRWLIVINVFLILFLGLTLGREFLKTREIQNEISQLQQQADSLATRNVSLKELQTAVQTESFIEREARLKLGLKKQGEEVVVIQEGEIGEGASLEPQDGDDPLGLVLNVEKTAPQVANSTKWWYYFFDKNAYELYASR